MNKKKSSSYSQKNEDNHYFMKPKHNKRVKTKGELGIETGKR